MLPMNVVELTKQLISIPAESRYSNRAVSFFLSTLMAERCFQVVELTFWDDTEEMLSLVARRGRGAGGLGLLCHSDTVPGGDDWEPFSPHVENGRLYGRGSCDMKGALAASLVAASRVSENVLQHPVWVIVASDEEAGLRGAQKVVAESRMFLESPPRYGVVCEATGMLTVYAHKGVVNFLVTAHGVSAHSSTGKGESASLKIAPFLAEMAELKGRFDSEDRFLNPEFDPPSSGLNLVINDWSTAHNVTSARTDCRICFRAMPNAAVDEAIALIEESARRYDLDATLQVKLDPFCGDRECTLSGAACRVTGAAAAVNVPYGTEAFIYQHHLEAVVLGPGNIAQAHTAGEFIDVGELEAAVEVYGALIDEFCAAE